MANIMLDPSLIHFHERTLSIGELLSTNNSNTYTSENDHTEFNSDVIESILVRIPLHPIIALGVTSNVYKVVNTFQFNPIVNYCSNLYKLSELKYLDTKFNRTFDDLHIAFRRRIYETNITVIMIPYYVREDIKSDIIR